eukprot:2789102-Rhodomonas_salina.2
MDSESSDSESDSARDSLAGSPRRVTRSQALVLKLARVSDSTYQRQLFRVSIHATEIAGEVPGNARDRVSGGEGECTAKGTCESSVIFTVHGSGFAAEAGMRLVVPKLRFLSTGTNSVAPDVAALVPAQLAQDVDLAAQASPRRQPAQGAFGTTEDASGQQTATEIRSVFQRLAQLHGEKVVRKVVACITLCKDGVSEMELMHLLSLDDDVLAEHYEPPVPVVSCIVVTRLLADLQPYLAQRGTSNAMGWYHRQFWEAAEAWLFGEDGAWLRERVHAEIADYFSGKYHGALKPYNSALRQVVQKHLAAESECDRLVPAQPAVLSGRVFELESSARFNERRLAGYVYHCVGAGLEQETRAELTSIFYIVYKFRAGMETELQQELVSTIQRFPGMKKTLEHVRTFIHNYIDVCRAPEVPWALLQAAYNEPDASPVRESLFVVGTKCFKEECGDFDTHCVKWLNRRRTFDPCKLASSHSSEVICVGVAEDGERIAFCCADNSVKILSASTGDVLCMIGHFDRVTTVSWGPNGHLASGSWDMTVKIWDMDSGTEKHSLTGHSGFVKSVSWGPNGELASGSLDGTLKIWDANTGTETRTLTGHSGVVTSVSWGPNGTVASGSWDTTVRIWDAHCGAEKFSLTGHTDRVQSVSWGPNGELASGSDDKTVRIWDAHSGTEQRALIGHSHRVHSVSWGPNGDLASGSEDKTVKVWDVHSGTEKCSLTNHSKLVNCVSWGPNGELASGSADKTIRIWDVALGTEQGSLTSHSRGVTVVSWGPNGELASGSEDKTMKIWDVHSGTEQGSLVGHSRGVTCLSWGLNGELASGSDDKTVRIWDACSCTASFSLTGHSDGVTSVSWGPNGELASGSNDKTVRIWDASNGAERCSLTGHSRGVTVVSWGPNGELASGSWDRTVRIWDAASGTARFCLTGHSGWVTSVSWGPNGELASGSWDNTVKVWFRSIEEMEISKKKKTSLSRIFCCWGRTCLVDQALCDLNRTSRPGFVARVMWGPNGELASGPHNKTVNIWDANTGTDARALRFSGGQVPLKGCLFCFCLLGHVVTADAKVIRVFRPNGTQVACVFGTSVVTAISCQGVHITAGCKSGEVLHFEAESLR